MPDWLEPMAATLTPDRFAGDDWLFERKYDGIRLIAYKRGRDVTLYSRNRLPQNIPAITTALAAMPEQELILDGEVTWDRQSGYHVFDILWLGRLDAIEIPETPPTIAKGLPKFRAHWVKPSIVVQVSFIAWTRNNKLRHPRLIGVRFDKSPHQVVRES
jgi:ATP-dependent DNA ligase